MKLSLGFITSRVRPEFGWFCDSLAKQVRSDDRLQIILVDTYMESDGRRDAMEGDFVDAFIRTGAEDKFISFAHTLPKPTIWAGKHKLVKEDWWCKSNSLNTFICKATYPFLAFVDDRCVLVQDWLQCVRDAMEGNYAVCGSYEKRSGMKVENGVIIEYGDLLGVDTRAQYGEPVATKDWYGGSCALQLEWCLAVNGFSEDLCDSLGSEDSQFGVTLHSSGYTMKFDSRMRIIEDRTPSEIGGALKRADKNPHLGQKAKSWDIVRAFHGKTTSQNSFDIRDMRARILKGESWREPSASHLDWYDQQPISEMT